MNQNPQDSQKILALLASRNTLANIGQVIQIMQNLDTLLPSSDGLKWFNQWYLRVTQAVYQKPPSGGWEDQPWLTKLDINFGGLYFDALANSYIDQTQVPRAWMALFEVRDNQNTQRVQFALAGINAHINHDLPLALIETCNSATRHPRIKRLRECEQPGPTRKCSGSYRTCQR